MALPFSSIPAPRAFSASAAFSSALPFFSILFPSVSAGLGLSARAEEPATTEPPRTTARDMTSERIRDWTIEASLGFRSWLNLTTPSAAQPMVDARQRKGREQSAGVRRQVILPRVRLGGGPQAPRTSASAPIGVISSQRGA